MSQNNEDSQGKQGFFMRLAARIGFDALSQVNEPEDPDDEDSPTLLGGFFQGIKDRAAEVTDRMEEKLVKKGATAVANDMRVVVSSVGERVKERTGSFFQFASEAINPTEHSTWEIIREKISPDNQFFKRLFARVLWIGSYISSFVGAGVAKIMGNIDEYRDNLRQNIETVTAGFISMFKLPEEKDEEVLAEIEEKRKKAGEQLRVLLTPEEGPNAWKESPAPTAA
jgi:hypothetical protein